MEHRRTPFFIKTDVTKAYVSFSKMGFGLTAEIVAEFAAKPFIQRALSNPKLPQSILSFWFGLDLSEPESISQLKNATILGKMTPFWFSSHPDYDSLCRSFSDTVREAGKGGELIRSNDWQTVDGEVARIILCDQLARNCFRGTAEAFAYDDVALELASKIATNLFSGADDISTKQYVDQVYSAYLMFCILPMMHSESLPVHETALKLVDYAASISTHDWSGIRKYELDHKKVVDRFGRYPHRNAKLGRESTEDEMAWLASDEVPGWAKTA